MLKICSYIFKRINENLFNPFKEKGHSLKYIYLWFCTPKFSIFNKSQTRQLIMKGNNWNKIKEPEILLNK